MNSSLDLLAGMPSPVMELTDLARMRLDTISFFLGIILLVAGVVRWIWNSFATDFPQLARLTYGGALRVTMLWSLLFVLVLTMISGARELMTPEAWERNGATYRLKNAVPPPNSNLPLRQARLESLRTALLLYAARHGGQFPADTTTAEISPELWQQVPPPSVGFEYFPPTDDPAVKPLVAERLVYQDSIQLVLLTDGTIRSLSPAELNELLPHGSANAQLP